VLEITNEAHSVEGDDKAPVADSKSHARALLKCDPSMNEKLMKQMKEDVE